MNPPAAGAPHPARQPAPGPAVLKPPLETALSRFLRYATIDTQSAVESATVPSTEKQLAFARSLRAELEALGADDVRLGDSGIVYARVPGNLPREADVPVVGFIAHLDTSPAVSGERVTPVIHRDYRGGDLVLPEDPTQVITPGNSPGLEDLIGDDIVTADGRTLLGSDDKSGIAAILTMIDTLAQNPDIPRGPIAVAFTPDEEISRGIRYFDLQAFGASVAYSVDGNGLGEINDETWHGRTATITFEGTNTHPGRAKGKMANAMYAAAACLSLLPVDMRPETTEGRAGFLHPYAGALDVERSMLKIALRDFESSGVEAKERALREIVAATQSRFPTVRIAIVVEEDYRNMKEVLRDHPELVERAKEATRRAGLEPFVRPLRGGSDGASLTFRGLPTPNLFTGSHNIHSRLEFNSRRGLDKTTETLVHLVRIFAAT